jgi:hypothetical protein
MANVVLPTSLSRRRRTHLGVTCIALALLALPAGAMASATGADASETGTHPRFDPADFVAGVDNPWFPLKPGTTFVYRGTKDGRAATDIFKVTHRTRVILGVTCVAIEDTLILGGHIGEHTTDWYAQDKVGRVWYLGERTAEYDAHGNVTSREGSWRAGLHGAKAGIFMSAHPHVGQTFRQEFLPGQAEDHFKVVSRTASVTVPYGSFDGVLKTHEWTPLEPGVLDAKFYVKGLGEVEETTVHGPVETLRLVQVIGV